jgi:excisionase family DNA binding protein
VAGKTVITASTQVDQLPEYLTPAEVAAFLRLKTGHVYEAVRIGSLPAIRVGKLIRIPKSAVVLS